MCLPPFLSLYPYCVIITIFKHFYSFIKLCYYHLSHFSLYWQLDFIWWGKFLYIEHTLCREIDVISSEVILTVIEGNVPDDLMIFLYVILQRVLQGSFVKLYFMAFCFVWSCSQDVSRRRELGYRKYKWLEDS